MEHWSISLAIFSRGSAVGTGDSKVYDVRDVANFVLDLADSHGIEITNLSLQKLLYFIHGWFYSLYDRPLIKNKFEAWQYGPVQRVLYDQFKVFRDRPIRKSRATYIDPETGKNIYKNHDIYKDHAELILEVLNKYAKFTASELVGLSHAEDSPWEFVWEQAEEVIYPGMRIPDEIIRDHFQKLDSILTIH
jgi:uncharacterized phage-associated protein